MRIERLFGTDDWLVFAAGDGGEVVYTIVETDGYWLDTPSKGEAKFNSEAFHIDWYHMLTHVWNTRDDRVWTPAAFVDTDGSICEVDVTRLRYFPVDQGVYS